MTAKLISVWCAGALVVGGVFWLGGQPSRADDAPAAAGQLMPVPGGSPATAPAPAPVKAQPPAPALAPVKGQPPEMVPTPVTAQPPASSLPDQPASVEDDESADFCGAPVCSPPGKYWLRADYLLWWTGGTRLPPLITTSPDGTPVGQAGVLGQSGTTVLFGDTTVGTNIRSGVRTTLGMWLDHCHVWDLEFDYLSLGERSDGFEMSSTGFPILARPFFNVLTNAQASELVAYPGVVEGTVTVDAKDYFQSAGVLLSRNLCSCNSCGSCDPCEDLCGGA